MINPRMIEAAFVGESYRVEYSTWDTSYLTSGRSSDGYGDVEYTVAQWKGWVTVRDAKTGECVAACNLVVKREEAYYERIRRNITPEGLLLDMEASYADFIGKRIVACFKAHRERGIPAYPLTAPTRQELLEAGFILDEHGQRTLALK